MMKENAQMNHTLPRTLIETLVRKAIHELPKAPKRCMRNLVDMALNFSDGRMQNRFFTKIQQLLRNSNSSYYELIPDVAAAVDTDRILTFALNVGYNSCTVGVKQIRDVEQKQHFSVPWSISLAISGSAYARQEEQYHALIRQGVALGVYAWMLYAQDDPVCALKLAAGHPECAFVLHCRPVQVDADLLEAALPVSNLMFAVQHTDGVEEACRLLRAQRFLYAVYHIYEDAQVDAILSGALLRDTASLHPAFTVFLAGKNCSHQARQAVHRYVSRMRDSQKCPTILWDTVGDSCLVDHVISKSFCLSGFDAQGYLYTLRGSGGRLERLEYNIFRQPLIDILSGVFPKALPATI